MGKKHKAKYGIKNRLQQQIQPIYHKKKGLSTKMKVFIGLVFLTIVGIVLAGSFLSKPDQTGPPGQPGESYPKNVSPVFYTTPIITSNGTKVELPSSFANANKLVFVDLKLEEPTNTLTYQGRTIPLAYYKNGNYLPLVVISTPTNKVVAGVRVCEPCGSFSFHIVQGSNLKCDVCGAEWDLENFAGVSGGCQTYPPPKLPSSVASNLTIDLSTLGVQVTS